MKKPSTETDTQSEVLPNEGGSYIRNPDNTLTKVEGTAPANEVDTKAEAEAASQ